MISITTPIIHDKTIKVPPIIPLALILSCKLKAPFADNALIPRKRNSTKKIMKLYLYDCKYEKSIANFHTIEGIKENPIAAIKLDIRTANNFSMLYVFIYK